MTQEETRPTVNMDGGYFITPERSSKVLTTVFDTATFTLEIDTTRGKGLFSKIRRWVRGYRFNRSIDRQIKTIEHQIENVPPPKVDPLAAAMYQAILDNHQEE